MSAKSKPTSAAISMAAMFDRQEVFDEVDVGLPPISPQARFQPRAVSLVDLSRLGRTWMLIGRGGSGKTMLARWMGSMLAEQQMLDRTVLAALDPTNRTLAAFFEDVQQPNSQDPTETAAFLRRIVKFAGKNQANGVWDFGGGDVSLAKLIEISPQFYDGMEQEGAAIVAAYMLTPAVDDLAILRSFEDRGFQPKTTALVLNGGRADNMTAFGALRAQPAYKAALARGAVEIIMPKLEPESLALEAERKRLHFFQARDGLVPEGSRVQPIDGLDAMMVRDWLLRMDHAFAPVQSWLPWT